MSISAENIANLEAPRAQLLATVFGPPNAYKANSCLLVEKDPDFDVILSDMERAFVKGKWNIPLIIPRRVQGDDALTWYACAEGESEFRNLVEEMSAFVGPSFSDFNAERAQLSKTDAIETALRSSFGNRVLRFRSVTLGDRKGAIKQVTHYLNLRLIKPKSSPIRVQSFGALRASFDRALLAKHEGEARAALSIMRSLRMLSAENSLFLEVRLLAGFERWDEIVGLKLFPQLASLKLPRETFADVIDALYRTEVAPIEAGGGVDDLVSTVGEQLFNRYPLLFRTRSDSLRPCVLKTFLLHAMTRHHQDAGFVQTLFKSIPSGAWPERIAKELSQRIGGFGRRASLADAQQALNDGELDNAFELFATLGVSEDAIVGMLSCASETESIAQGVRALARFGEAEKASQLRIEKRLPKTLQKVRKIATPSEHVESADSHWINEMRWAKATTSEEDYIARLREGAEIWDPLDPKLTTAVAEELAGYLVELAIENPDLFECAYPLFYRLFIDRSDKPSTRSIAIYQALIETIRQRGSFGRDELALVVGAATFMLSCAPEARAYGALLEELRGILNAIRSPRALDWAIDMCDELALSACSDSESRLQFVTMVLGIAGEFYGRLSDLHRAVLDLVTRDLGVKNLSLPPPETITVEERHFDHLRVGIYSLDEGATKRAEGILERLYPGLRVEVNQDIVCTERLKALARRADLFAFAWKCSSHQAFYCVKDHITESSRVLLASGGGSASLVRALSERLSSIQNS